MRCPSCVACLLHRPAPLPAELPHFDCCPATTAAPPCPRQATVVGGGYGPQPVRVNALQHYRRGGWGAGLGAGGLLQGAADGLPRCPPLACPPPPRRDHVAGLWRRIAQEQEAALGRPTSAAFATFRTRKAQARCSGRAVERWLGRGVSSAGASRSAVDERQSACHRPLAPPGLPPLTPASPAGHRRALAAAPRPHRLALPPRAWAQGSGVAQPGVRRWWGRADGGPRVDGHRRWDGGGCSRAPRCERDRSPKDPRRPPPPAPALAGCGHGSGLHGACWRRPPLWRSRCSTWPRLPRCRRVAERGGSKGGRSRSLVGTAARPLAPAPSPASPAGAALAQLCDWLARHGAGAAMQSCCHCQVASVAERSGCSWAALPPPPTALPSPPAGPPAGAERAGHGGAAWPGAEAVHQAPAAAAGPAGAALGCGEQAGWVGGGELVG